MNKGGKNKKGFTLIELLVVIAIIGTLSSVAVINLTESKNKGSAAKMIKEIKQVETGLRVMWNEEGRWATQCDIQAEYGINGLFCEGGEYPYGSGSCSLPNGCNHDPEPTIVWFIDNTEFSQFFPPETRPLLASYEYDNDNDSHDIGSNGCILGSNPGDPVGSCNIRPYRGVSLYIQGIDYQEVIDQTIDGGDGGCCGKFLYEQSDLDMGRGIYKLGNNPTDF